MGKRKSKFGQGLAMIYPFLNMTIKGAIWYQGESNAGTAYSCDIC